MVEIKFGEGGDDSKAFVQELATVYLRYGRARGFGADVLATTEGSVTLQFSGRGVWSAFRHEPGKHVVQRCPPTERGSRRHTSMVSVAVLPLFAFRPDAIREQDIDVKTQGGHGPGGQHQNKSQCAVRMVHRPTGIQVFINGRSQFDNKRKAMEILVARVNAHKESAATSAHNQHRREQLGSGGRGAEKTRTWNFYENSIVDHRLSRQTGDIKSVMKGRLDLLLGS